MMLPVPFAMTIIKHLNSPSSAARDISRVVKAPFRRHHQQQRRARAAKTAEMPFPPPRYPNLALTEVFPSQYEMGASDKLHVVKTSTLKAANLNTIRPHRCPTFPTFQPQYHLL